MSSILKALKKLEQDPNGGGAAMDLWQRKTDPEKTFDRNPRRPRPRTIALFVFFVSFLAISGWLLLKYASLPSEKSQPGKPLPQSKGAVATNMSAGAAPAPEKTDLEPKASSPPMPRTTLRKEKVPARKTVAASRTGLRALGKKEEKLPAVVNRTQAKTQLKPPAMVDSRSFQTAREPSSAYGSPSPKGEPVLNKDDKAYPSPVSSYPPRTVGKPAVDESSVLTGFSVQAIAWSKLPAERIAVINGAVVREGGVVEGIQVIQIDLDEVYLKKGDKTWMLKCGR